MFIRSFSFSKFTECSFDSISFLLSSNFCQLTLELSSRLFRFSFSFLLLCNSLFKASILFFKVLFSYSFSFSFSKLFESEFYSSFSHTFSNCEEFICCCFSLAFSISKFLIELLSYNYSLSFCSADSKFLFSNLLSNRWLYSLSSSKRLSASFFSFVILLYLLSQNSHSALACSDSSMSFDYLSL